MGQVFLAQHTRIARTGTTTVTRLASSQAIQTMPGTIAVDAAGVYWATTTAIMAIAK
jgi:hypothetical protein